MAGSGSALAAVSSTGKTLGARARSAVRGAPGRTLGPRAQQAVRGAGAGDRNIGAAVVSGFSPGIEALGAARFSTAAAYFDAQRL